MKINRVVHLHFEDGTERMEFLRNMEYIPIDYWNPAEVRENVTKTMECIKQGIPIWESFFEKKISCVSWLSCGEEYVYYKEGVLI